MTARDELKRLAECLTDEQADHLLAEAVELFGLAPFCCPSCTERRMDSLQWGEQDEVTCLTCQTTFDPEGGWCCNTRDHRG